MCGGWWKVGAFGLGFDVGAVADPTLTTTFFVLLFMCVTCCCEFGVGIRAGVDVFDVLEEDEAAAVTAICIGGGWFIT